MSRFRCPECGEAFATEVEREAHVPCRKPDDVDPAVKAAVEAIEIEDHKRRPWPVDLAQRILNLSRYQSVSCVMALQAECERLHGVEENIAALKHALESAKAERDNALIREDWAVKIEAERDELKTTVARLRALLERAQRVLEKSAVGDSVFTAIRAELYRECDERR